MGPVGKVHESYCAPPHIPLPCNPLFLGFRKGRAALVSFVFAKRNTQQNKLIEKELCWLTVSSDLADHGRGCTAEKLDSRRKKPVEEAVHTMKGKEWL